MGCWPQGLLEAVCGTQSALARRENSRSWSTASRCNEICKSRGQLGTAGQVRKGQDTYICRLGRVRLTDEMSSCLRPVADAGQRAYLYGLKHWMYLVGVKNMSISGCLQDFGLPFCLFHVNLFSIIVTLGILLLMFEQRVFIALYLHLKHVIGY